MGRLLGMKWNCLWSSGEFCLYRGLWSNRKIKLIKSYLEVKKKYLV